MVYSGIMSWQPVLNRKETLIGHTDPARVIYPSIRASVRRSDPDGFSSVPYYSLLLGKNLIISIIGTVNATYNIIFVSDSYGDAITTIDSADPVNLKAEDDNGFLRVTNLNGGNKNAIKITGGTAAAILGFDIFPLPTAISYAGEISTTATGWPYQINEQLTSLISKDEGFQASSFNRALAAIMTMNDSITSNQDREMAFPRRIDVVVSGGAFSVTGLDANERLFISGNTLSPILISNPNLDTLDKYLVFLDRNDNQVFVNDIRTRISSVTYGTYVTDATSFTTWGTPDGKSVFGDALHSVKPKTTGSIDRISGNVLFVPGALFVTNRVQPNDTVIISGATNNTPFNHNGDFIIEAVIDEENIIVRPKGDSDAIFDSGNPPPASLNTNIQLGEVYGNISVPIGRFLPFTMPGANMVFTLSPAPPDGNYRLIAPIGRTIRNVLAEDITLSTISRPFGGQIELGSKLDGAGNGAKPRIISVPNTIDSYTLLLQSGISGAKKARLYVTPTGGFVTTINASWNGVGFIKDINGEEAYKLDLSKTQFLLHGVKATDNAAWTTGTLIARFKNNDKTVSSLNEIGNGLVLGTEVASTTAEMLIPRIEYTTCSDIGQRTLLSRTNNILATGPFIREYSTYENEYTRTFNAYWDGTNWNKDVIGTSAKSTFNSSGIVESIHSDPTGLVTQFTNAQWQTREIVKNYQFDENFTADYSSTTSGNITSLMKVGLAPTNVTHKVTSDLVPGTLVTSGLFGIFSAAGTLAAPFSIQANSRIAFGTGTRDFVIKTKIKVPNIGILDTSADLDDPGLFVGIVGISDAPPPTYINQVGVLIGGTDTNWKARVDTTDYDLHTPFTSDWTTFTFEKKGSNLEISINNVLKLVTTLSTGIDLSQVDIRANGTATSPLQTAVAIDYIKVWLADY